MSAYIAALNREWAAEQARRAEEERLGKETAARERIAPLDERLKRLLASIPEDQKVGGLSLPELQAGLRGRRRGNPHPGDLAAALRRLGYRRERRWRGDAIGFRAFWRKSC